MAQRPVLVALSTLQLEHERELGLVSDAQGDQIERQGTHLEQVRDRLPQEPD